MPTLEKEELVEEIKDRFSRSEAVILVDYRGLTVKELQALRGKLRECGCELRVYKNTLTEIALRELAMPELGGLLEGPTAFTFGFGDPVAPAKALTAFAKDHKALELKGGLVQRAVMSADDVKFRKPVLPGDTIFIHAELTKSRGERLAKAKCHCVVNDAIVSEGELMFTFLDK